MSFWNKLTGKHSPRSSPEESISVEEARKIGSYFFEFAWDSVPSEQCRFLPVDWLKYSPTTIYKALKVHARHNGKEEKTLELALQLARFSSVEDVSHASFIAQRGSEQGHIFQQKLFQRSMQNQEDLELAVRTDWQLWMNRGPVTQEPNFPNYNNVCSYNCEHMENTVRNFGQLIVDSGGSEIPISKLSEPRCRILFCLASSYVICSNRTKADFERLSGGADMLSSVVFDDEVGILSSKGSLSDERTGGLLARKEFDLAFFHQGFWRITRRISNETGISIEKY